jgi:hypothetical protein
MARDRMPGKLVRASRERTIERVLDVFRGHGVGGDTIGNSRLRVGRVQRDR